MTATQAPTPGPLSGDEPLNVLLDRAVAAFKALPPEEQRRQFDEQKKSWVAAEMAWGDEGTRLCLAPTAPVEASGSERDEIARLIWQRFAPSSDMDEANALRGEYVLVADDIMNLRPQPSGETREAVARVEAMLPAIERIFPVHVTETPDYAELAFHECAAQAMTMEPDTWTALNTLATDLRALLSALALGGQHSTATDFPPDDVLACVDDTTPARAEAQDEGAATRGWDREICTGCSSSLSISDIKEGGFVSCCPDRRMVKVSDLVDAFEASRRAHPSPTPAADADRVRREIKAWTDTQFPKSCRVGSAKWVNGLTTRVLAALKSTAAKGESCEHQA